VITLSNTSAKLSFNFHSMDKTEQYCHILSDVSPPH